MTAQGDDVEAAVAAHLREAAPGWYGDLVPGEVDVRVVHRGRHPSSRTWLVDLGPGHRVVVKVPDRQATPEGRAERPRIVALPDFASKHALEASALATAARHFAAAPDPRLGTVRLLDHVEALGAVVMEAVPHPTLATLLRRAFARRVRPAALVPAFANAGAWLHRYHELAPAPGTARRLEEPEQVAALLAEFGAFLAGRGAGAHLPGLAAASVERLCRDALAAAPPPALAHGDFGPPNVFVGPGDRVTGYDMTGAWAAPPLQDVAYLLTSTETDGPLLVARGAAAMALPIARYEAAFLAGYFGTGPVPERPLAVFRLLTLLDRWAALAVRGGRRGRLGLALAGPRLSALAHRHLDVASRGGRR